MRCGSTTAARRRGGPTPFEQVNQRIYQRPVLPFGTPVWLRRPDALLQTKLELHWNAGLWLGRLALGDENIAITDQGIIMSRTCRPMPAGAIQDMTKFLEQLDWGLPTKGHPSKLPSVRMKAVPGAEFTAPPGVMRGRPGTVQLHQYYAECGRTPGCAACQYGASGRAHSSACNTRRREWLGSKIQEQKEQRAQEMKEKKEKKRVAEEAMPELAPEEKVMRRLRGKQMKWAREEDGGDLREEKKHVMMEPDSGDVGMKEAEEEEQGPPWVKVTPQAKTVATPVVVPSSSDELMSEPEASSVLQHPMSCRGHSTGDARRQSSRTR